VLAEDGREVLARTPATASRALATGTTVWATWEPSAVHVFPEGQG